MKKYFTIAKTKDFYGNDIFDKGMEVILVKDKDNTYDSETINVVIPGFGKVGYVANSPISRLGESYSAGRLYDKFEKEASGIVIHILDKGVICEFVEE